MKMSPQDDAYRFALSASWPAFFALWAAVFLGVNAFFALLYSLDIAGVAGARPGSYFDVFFFSVETFVTVGYGEMVPRSAYARILVIVEAFASITSLALATGMIFARFVRPHARIVFAPVIAIAPIAGVPTLMAKIGNRRRDAIVEASARMWLIRTEIFEDAEGRRFSELALDKPDHPIVLDAWTLFHTIDARSPLFELDEAVLRAIEPSILVTFRGTDERTAQTVAARREYAAGEFAWNKRFKAAPDLQRRRRRRTCLEFDLVDTSIIQASSK